jgi:hypothetical protein
MGARPCRAGTCFTASCEKPPSWRYFLGERHANYTCASEIFSLRSCGCELACAMRRSWRSVLTTVGFLFITGLPVLLARESPAQDKSAAPSVPAATLHATRSSPANLEVGGELAGHPWLVLSAWAVSSPEYFAAYVRDPKVKNSRAEMSGNPGCDDVTIGALPAYFQTFSPQEKP